MVVRRVLAVVAGGEALLGGLVVVVLAGTYLAFAAQASDGAEVTAVTPSVPELLRGLLPGVAALGVCLTVAVLCLMRPPSGRRRRAELATTAVYAGVHAVVAVPLAGLLGSEDAHALDWLLPMAAVALVAVVVAVSSLVVVLRARR